jgi:PAS domain S-box-containing protein
MPTPKDDKSRNAFEGDMPGTEARTLAEKAIERLRKEGGLFVDAVRATRMAMAVTDPTLPGNPIVFANDAFLKLSGYRMEEVLGQQPYFMNGPDTDPDDVARFQEALRHDQDDLVETIQYRKDGTRFVASVLLSAFKDDEGNTVSHFLSWLDVTRRTNAENRLGLLQQAQAALRESEARLSAMLESVPVGLAAIDLDGKTILANAEYRRFLPNGTVPSRDPERGDRWKCWDEEGRLLDPENWPSARSLRGEKVIPGQEMIYTDDDGREVWTNVATIPTFDDEGLVTGVVTVISDIDAVKRSSEALKDSEQHQRLLLAELQHRVRNSLAVVRSIARRTADNSSSVEEMLGHFQGRLDAFSRVQAALTRTASAKVELMGLVEDELLTHAVKENGNLLIEGPEILLDPRTAERLSLAIHELTTNAVKHGALGRDSGKILIRWEVEDGEENGKQFNLAWRESGVGLTRTKVKREGFGMDLLRHSLPYDLQAETKVELTPDGLHFELKMPLPRNAETRASNREPVLTAD